VTITVKREAAARLHNELRPIHFINHGSFTSAAINLQVQSKHYKIVMFSKINLQSDQQAVESLALFFQVYRVYRGRNFAAELLREYQFNYCSVTEVALDDR
jgi:hypothetical protein